MKYFFSFNMIILKILTFNNLHGVFSRLYKVI